MSDSVTRFNKYTSATVEAANKVIQAFLHLVRPTGGFPHYPTIEIQRAWQDWVDAEEVFYWMTSKTFAHKRVFPKPPPDDEEHVPCRQMWGLLIQEQVEGQKGQAAAIRAAVAAIMASEACKSHPETCSCHVPENPWTCFDCVAALQPLRVKHSLACECGGRQGLCLQRSEGGLISAGILAKAAATNTSPYDYKHHVDTCACGTCYKARVDSGTQGAYAKSIAAASAAISAAAVKSGGADKPEFAKNLFAEMGTPHDSKCPHGLPFYACMPCSH